MKYTLTISLDNAAFDGEGGPWYELGRILGELSNHALIHREVPEGRVFDVNGNTVGTGTVTLDQEAE